MSSASELTRLQIMVPEDLKEEFSAWAQARDSNASREIRALMRNALLMDGLKDRPKWIPSK